MTSELDLRVEIISTPLIGWANWRNILLRFNFFSSNMGPACPKWLNPEINIWDRNRPKIGLISSENWDILGQFGFGGMGMSLLKYLVTDFSSKEKNSVLDRKIWYFDARGQFQRTLYFEFSHKRNCSHKMEHFATFVTFYGK